MAMSADFRLDAPPEILGRLCAVLMVRPSSAQPATNGIPEQVRALGWTAPQRIEATVQRGMSQATAR